MSTPQSTSPRSPCIINAAGQGYATICEGPRWPAIHNRQLSRRTQDHVECSFSRRTGEQYRPPSPPFPPSPPPPRTRDTRTRTRTRTRTPREALTFINDQSKAGGAAAGLSTILGAWRVVAGGGHINISGSRNKNKKNQRWVERPSRATHISSVSPKCGVEIGHFCVLFSELGLPTRSRSFALNTTSEAQAGIVRSGRARVSRPANRSAPLPSPPHGSARQGAHPLSSAAPCLPHLMTLSSGTSRPPLKQREAPAKRHGMQAPNVSIANAATQDARPRHSPITFSTAFPFPAARPPPRSVIRGRGVCFRNSL